MTLTKQQRVALKRVFDRKPTGQTYRQFRRTVRGSFDCIMVEWQGMWLGIEADGYTHS